MSLFTFIKDAGASLFKRGVDTQVADDAAAEKSRGEAIERHVSESGLQIEDFRARVQGSTALLGGRVPDAPTREKVVLMAGNVAGIETVDDRMERMTSVAEAEPASEPESNFYTVVRGDTLGKIAKEQYGSASKYPIIFEANRPMLEDPDKIYPGQVLRIPPLEA